MKNRLEYIQKLINEGVYSPGGDVAWLVAEVERLRVQLKHHDDLKRAVNQGAKTIAELQRQLKEDRCDPQRGYHSSPHKGCILR